MAAEIKNLDTDLQMLVYENYNKFISATDTIKRCAVSLDLHIPYFSFHLLISLRQVFTVVEMFVFFLQDED